MEVFKIKLKNYIIINKYDNMNNNKYGENKRDIIIKELEILSNKELIAKNFFKVRAYNKVIEQLKALEIISNINDIKNIQGIGSKIRTKIEEILKTGKLKAAEKAREIKDISVYEELLKIYGIGISKAEELINIYNIKSIEQLKNEVDKNPDILNETQKGGLKYYYDIQLKIPKVEIDKHLKKIKNLIKGIDTDLIIKGVGSYRRQKSEVGDIDILMTTKESKKSKTFGKVIEKLKESNYLVADFAKGKKKYMGICKLNKKTPFRRIDILITTFEEYPFALLYFTGDFDINIELRKKASEIGYKLNEYGIVPTQNKPKLELKTEKEIFNFLGYKYIVPKNRNIKNLKEIE